MVSAEESNRMNSSHLLRLTESKVGMTLYLANCMISHLYFTADLLELFWAIACMLNFPFESCKVQPANAKPSSQYETGHEIEVIPMT